MTVQCCLTSWPARILNCHRVVSSLLGNTVRPDRIWLTLARTQFPNGLDDLPPLLRRDVVGVGSLHLNWVDVDTRIMKKVIPVLQFMEDDDLVLPVDDDILYPSDYVESRLRDFGEKGGQPLTGCVSQRDRTLWRNWGIPSSIGYSCAFQKRHVEGICRFANQEIVDANNEDGTYSMVEWLNGFHAQSVGRYGMDWLREHCSYNETSPSRLNGSYLSGPDLLRVFEKRVRQVAPNWKGPG